MQQMWSPLHITVSIDRDSGLVGHSNNALASRALEDCKLLINALEQITGALRERRIALEIEAAKQQHAESEESHGVEIVPQAAG